MHAVRALKETLIILDHPHQSILTALRRVSRSSPRHTTTNKRKTGNRGGVGSEGLAVCPASAQSKPRAVPDPCKEGGRSGLGPVVRADNPSGLGLLELQADRRLRLDRPEHLARCRSCLVQDSSDLGQEGHRLLARLARGRRSLRWAHIRLRCTRRRRAWALHRLGRAFRCSRWVHRHRIRACQHRARREWAPPHLRWACPRPAWARRQLTWVRRRRWARRRRRWVRRHLGWVRRHLRWVRRPPAWAGRGRWEAHHLRWVRRLAWVRRLLRASAERDPPFQHHRAAPHRRQGGDHREAALCSVRRCRVFRCIRPWGRLLSRCRPMGSLHSKCSRTGRLCRRALGLV